MKIVTDHGFPKASDGTDGNALEAFKNERDYIAQNGHFKTTAAAMDWAVREIEKQRAALRAFAEHFEVKEGPKKNETQYGHLELWYAAKSVNEEADALHNPKMLMASAESSFSLACMNALGGALDNACGVLVSLNNEHKM